MIPQPVPPEQIENLSSFLNKYPEAGIGYFFGMVYAIVPEKTLENFSLSCEGIEYFLQYIEVLRKDFLGLPTYLRLDKDNFFKILQKVDELLTVRLESFLGKSNQKMNSKIEELEYRVLELINNDSECCFLYSYFSIIHEEGEIK
jgi:hypothetical protein